MISADKGNFIVKRFSIGPLATNCYVVHDIGTGKGVLIDPGTFSRGISKYIDDEGIDIVYTVNTHGHADHIMGDTAFGFPVLIHELDEPYLNDSSKNLAFLGGFMADKIHAARLLKDGDRINAGDLDFEVIHTPGHTPGGISLRIGNSLFSGDTLFLESIGRSDCPGGNGSVLMNSIKDKLMTLPDSIKVLPGHGPETTIGHERRSNPFL